jgi:hypothetical protein
VRVVAVRQRTKPTRAVTIGLVGLGGGSVVDRHHARPTVISTQSIQQKQNKREQKKKKKENETKEKKIYKCMFANIRASLQVQSVNKNDAKHMFAKVRATIKS